MARMYLADCCQAVVCDLTSSQASDLAGAVSYVEVAAVLVAVAIAAIGVVAVWKGWRWIAATLRGEDEAYRPTWSGR